MSTQGSKTGKTYSKRLGELTSQQFQAALSRFGLGEFVEAKPVSHGLFSQNVFVTSTISQYVLRGLPHYPWQFPKECFGAALLHEHTQVPVAYTYLFDPATDIFGWSYLIMPCMPGISPSDSQLSKVDQLNIARAMGHNLAQMHTLTWPFSGSYDLTSNTIQPFPEGFPQWFIKDISNWVSQTQNHGAITSKDLSWIEETVKHAQSTLYEAFQPCFVMNDYNPNNVVVNRVDGEWRVTGLFDLMEYYFGNGEADLVRLMAIYLDAEHSYGLELATSFVRAYLEDKTMSRNFEERFKLFMLRDRLIIWEYGSRPGVNWFAKEQSFRDYAERYLASLDLLKS